MNNGAWNGSVNNGARNGSVKNWNTEHGKNRRIMQAAEGALEALFPAKCAICGRLLSRDEDFLCARCDGKINYAADGPVCTVCGRPLAFSESVMCGKCLSGENPFCGGAQLFIYDENIKPAIYAFKYKNIRDIGRHIGRRMHEHLGETAAAWNADALIPVPVHKKRYLQRGFNQSEIIADSLGGLLGTPVRTDVLFRVRQTRPQKQLGTGQRARNLEGAFRADREKASGLGRVILIDDIYTSGATLGECARVLKDAGTDMIFFLTAAVVVDYERASLP